jgi:transcriptional regulator with XRE-family HTH domain
MVPHDELPEIRPYTPSVMGRPLTKPRPKQGAHLAALRRAAGLSQAELARAIGESQQSIAFWELSAKPPRSEVVPKLAKALGVPVDVILGEAPRAVRRPGPVSKLQQTFEKARALSPREQELVIRFIDTLVDQRKAG